MTMFKTSSTKRHGEFPLTRTKPLLASIPQVKTTSMSHINSDEFLMKTTESTDRFVSIEHLIEFLEVARKEGKARSAHPPALTVVGVLLEDIATIRIHVGRTPAVNMNLFETTIADEALAEVDADTSIAESLADVREMANQGQLTAEAFTSAIFAHPDYLRAARHVLEPKFFYDAHHQDAMGVSVGEIGGSVTLEAKLTYKLILSPINVNAVTHEVTSFLMELEGTCCLFHPRDRLTRKIQLVGFADDTFQLIAMCAALNLHFSAKVSLRLRVMPFEFRYMGEVEEVLELDALTNEIRKAQAKILPGLF